MNADSTTRQRLIIDWFNRVYSRKGDRYLRPVRAYYIFLELLQAREGQHLLDVACGLGRMLQAAREYDLAMSGIDISEVAVAKAQSNVPEAAVKIGNAERLPYLDSQFDLVTCTGSIERFLNKDRALGEMHRVGKADAQYCMLVRNSNTLGWQSRSRFALGPNTGNANACSLDEWTKRFELNNFRIKSVLPDQYPLHRRSRWSSLFLRPADYRQPVYGSLDRANEFIFLLEKSA